MPGGAPENSLAAFDAACVAGYGIELDVQLSSDGEAMVLHDTHLARMAGASAKLKDKTAAELSALRLKGTREPIPTLRQVLDLVDGRSLVLVEIKTRLGEEGPLDERVAEVIEGYHGPLSIIGFNPYSHAWWADHRPEVLRGLDSYSYKDEAAEKLPDGQRRAFRALGAHSDRQTAFPGLERRHVGERAGPAVSRRRLSHRGLDATLGRAMGGDRNHLR